MDIQDRQRATTSAAQSATATPGQVGETDCNTATNCPLDIPPAWAPPTVRRSYQLRWCPVWTAGRPARSCLSSNGNRRPRFGVGLPLVPGSSPDLDDQSTAETPHGRTLLPFVQGDQSLSACDTGVLRRRLRAAIRWPGPELGRRTGTTEDGGCHSADGSDRAACRSSAIARAWRTPDRAHTAGNAPGPPRRSDRD